MNHSGSHFTEGSLAELLAAVRDPDTRQAAFGRACFEGATFDDRAKFLGVVFGNARFDGAVFGDEALFSRSVFGDGTTFAGARFGDSVRFSGATFGDKVSFDQAVFGDGAKFTGATLGERAGFEAATFGDNAGFDRATLGRRARFIHAVFGSDARFDSATFRDDATFDRATFGHGVKFSKTAFGESTCFLGAVFSGYVVFNGAVFGSNSGFNRAVFKGAAGFAGAVFGDGTKFTGTTFDDRAGFNSVTFGDDAGFNGATFRDDAWFTGTTFGDRALFRRSRFARARFHRAVFGADAGFNGATFQGIGTGSVRFLGDVSFANSRLEGVARFGPLVCSGRVDLSGAMFELPVTIEVAAARLVFRRTRWATTAAVWVRCAEVDLTDAVFEYPLSVASRHSRFKDGNGQEIDETPLSHSGRSVRISSIQGVDAAHLTLNDVDLSRCLFAGAVNLDQLSIEGECVLGRSPRGWHRRGLLPVRWSERRTISEEHHWRAAEGFAGWQETSPLGHVLTPAALAPLYRQLRKSHEDGKDEPGAADFYYGEMEMRRKSRTRPRGERLLLQLYWLLSGYGLRTSRALAWLGVAMGATILAMTAWGLPKDDPKPTSRGELHGGRAVLVTDTPAPRNPDGPLLSRFSADRFENALRVVINSVVFRSSGQELTTTGTYVEMASRVTEPVLLGLAALAIRGRVKR